MKKRNVNIELLRIISCILAIAIHCVGGRPGTSVEAANIILTFSYISTPIFFTILGFFSLDDNLPYADRLKRLGRRVVIPTVIAVVCNMILEPVLDGKACIHILDFQDVCKLMRILFHGDLSTELPKANYLWFMLSYIRITLWMPVLKMVCKEDTTAIRRGVMLSIFAYHTLKFLGVLFQVQVLTDGLYYVLATDHAILLVLLGYEIKHYLLPKKTSGYVYLGLFLILNAAFILSQIILVSRSCDISGLYNSNNPVSIVSSALIFLYVMRMSIPDRLHKIIYFLSDKAFGIYMVHYPLRLIIRMHLSQYSGYDMFKLSWTCILTALCFLYSLLMVYVFKGLKDRKSVV